MRNSNIGKPAFWAGVEKEGSAEREPGSDGVSEIPNHKYQITNIKQITITKIRNSKPVLVIDYWNLRFVCNLVLGV